MMQRVWMIVAAVAVVVAAVFLLRREFNAAFFVAALAAIAWFLNYRVQMKTITKTAESQSGSKEDELED